MEDRIFLEEGKPFYKANLHCHTTISDGRMTPEEIRAAYKKEGYSVVAYTDHCRYRWHRELEDESFLPLAAYETQIDEGVWGDRAKTYHINFYDCEPWKNPEEKKGLGQTGLSYGDIEGINKYVAEMKEKGFLACYNHPYWSLQDARDYRNLQGFWAMEIYNYGCEQEGLYGYNPQAYDEMLRAGQEIFCVATDDNHDVYPIGTAGNDSFGGFTMIQADEFSYEGVIRAMKEGRFYASMGPEIRALEIKDGKLEIKTSEVQKIFVKQEGRRCYCLLAEEGQSLTEAAFPLDGREGYIRVECRDALGRYACSNAYPIR